MLECLGSFIGAPGLGMRSRALQFEELPFAFFQPYGKESTATVS